MKKIQKVAHVSLNIVGLTGVPYAGGMPEFYEAAFSKLKENLSKQKVGIFPRSTIWRNIIFQVNT